MSNVFDVDIRPGKSIPWSALYLNSTAINWFRTINLTYTDISEHPVHTYQLISSAEFQRTMNAKYSTVAWPTWIKKVDGVWERQEIDISDDNAMSDLVGAVVTAINNYLSDHGAAFFHVYKATVLASYDPLANYDRKETRTLTKSGTETLTKSGSETLTQGGTETHTNRIDANDPVTSKGYNTQMDVAAESEVNKSVSTGTTTDTLTLNDRTDSTSFNDRKDTTSFDERVDSESIRAYGNIGVTTSQQMAESAIDLGAKEAFLNWAVGQVVEDLFIFK